MGNPIYDFKDQVALVTGAGSVMGLVTAKAFAEAGAGWVIAQSELRPDTFALHLETLLGDQAGLTLAAQRAGDFGRPDAARELAQLTVELGLALRAQGRAA